MIAREVLSETQAARLRGVLLALDLGLTMTRTAELMEITVGRLCTELGRLLGKSHWPPSRADLAALLALPVVPDEAAHAIARARRAPLPDIAASPLERAIAEREARNVASHRARERHWLELERAKYGLPRCGLPLSGMAA